jgi:signal transduction histidine kinase
MILHGLISSACNTLASLMLVVAVFSRRPREPRALTFTWVMLSVAVWSGLYFGWMLARTAEDALLYCRALSAAAIFIPVAYYHFVTRLTERPRNREVAAAYAAAALLAALCLTPWMIVRVEPNRWFPFWPRPGRLYPAYLAFFFAYFIRLTFLLWSEWRRANYLRRNQLLYVLVYTLLGFLGGSTNYFLWYGIPVPPVGNILIAAYMIGVGYAVIRFRLMEFNLLIARLAGGILLVAALAAGQTALTRLLARLWGDGEAGGTEIFLAALAVGAVLFTFLPAARRRMDSFLEQRVLGRDEASRARLLQLPQRISTLQDEEAIYQETVQTVAEALQAGRTALFLRLEFEAGFRPRAATGWPAGSEAPPLADGHPLVGLLQRASRGVLLAELEQKQRGAEGQAAAAFRREQQIELLVPVFADTFFYGCLAVGARPQHGIFTDTEISLLEAIGLQVGLNLRARQLERRANQAEKLISLGTLAAGLAHELRNPLVSIRTFAALMEEQGGDAEFRREFRAVVERDARRIGSIIEHVSAFAENTRVKFAPVRVDEVVQAVYEIARPEFVHAGVAFAAPSAGLPAVHGNYGQLLQVFLNLFQNAIHALDGRPTPRVEVSAQVAGGEAGARMLVLAVADNGAGIEPALLARVFEPFVSSKATGDSPRRGSMGLGLALVKRIVEGHRGAITVTSEPGRGTTFFVHLPCLP